MEIREKIKNLIEKTLNQDGIELVDFSIDHPTEISHGDYSTNVAMILAKKMKANPVSLAEELAKKIEKDEDVDRVTVAGQGFINFYLSSGFFTKALQEVLTKADEFGKNKLHEGKKILVEHSSPNLFKPFHIGHVMNNAVGESITRLAEFSGTMPIKISYPSDVSLGIGKAVWSLLEGGAGHLDSLESVGEKLIYLGKCYADGTKAYEENPAIEKRVREITEIIYEKRESPEYEAYLKGREINLKYFEDITERLGSKFNDFIFESEAGEKGKEIVLKNVGKIFEESDGAIIYKGENDGLHTRVFINKEGYPTYEAKDIGLLFLKFEKYNPDISILVTDREQSEYYKVVLSAAGKINHHWKNKTIHRTHGRMSFKGEKMSSRLGNTPLAVDILDTVAEEVKNRMTDSPNQERVDEISIAALKFTILKAMAGKNINFDPETSLSFEGDSGPYLQYTRARGNSILEKALNLGIQIEEIKSPGNITEVEKYLYRFPEVVELSIKEWAPHHIAGYLLSLAQSFNSWYGSTKIVDIENVNASYNLAITKAVGQVIKNGLYLLGIKSPDRM